MAHSHRQSHRQSRWTLAAALGASLLIHPAVGALYDVTRTPIRPKLLIDVKKQGKGQGVVLSMPEGVHCVGSGKPGDGCEMEVEPGARVSLVATRGDKSTFGGWDGPCGTQAYRGFAWALDALYGANVAGEVPAPGQPGRQLYEALMLAAAQPTPADPLTCDLIVDHTMRITAEFGEQPDEVQVEWQAMADEPEKDITLPDPTLEAENVVRVEPPKPRPKRPKPPEIEPQKPPELALVEPPKVVPPPPPPPPPKPPPKQEKKQQQVEAPRMKAVEVPDDKKTEVAKAPDDAHFLSDKNRDVAEETHAKDTNLEREQKGKVAASQKSDDTRSEEVGGAKDNIKQLEESESSELDARREDETSHSGKDKIARGIDKGKEGQAGQGGQEGDGSKATRPGMLSMRGITGRGAPGGPVVDMEREGDGGSRQPGDGGRRGRAGKAGERGIKTQLEFDDYERIVGHDKSEEEQKVARRTKSLRRGRWEQKLAAVKSSLENFTPEVRPGNQTALKTRAAPFALYIARMHRRIHELWGFGFLEDLDKKPASNEMNDWNLWTKLEIVINNDGTVDKVNIVRGSGVLTFDVAALDTVLTAGPYEPPPEAIHSADGKTYLHWAFHRDWRECGTFGAEPYILTTPPRGPRDQLDDSKMLGRVPGMGKNGKGGAGGGAGAAGASEGAAGAAGAGDGAAGVPGAGQESGQQAGSEPADDGSAQASAARAQGSAPTPDDPRAAFAANLWLSGFAHGDIAKMVRVSGIPFNAGGVTAQSGSEIGSIYRNILSETRTRAIREWKVLSAAGYRKAVGALPDGLEPGPADLFMVVRLKGEQLTLLLREHSQSGEYKAVGLFR
ncbi:MAG TPA: TonB family protein [Kofleriaceae bacterium]|nr:TonB family protein [Kofleriaceae bacterium]